MASAIVALTLVGCNGKTGAAGAPGTNGTNGTNGAYALDATTLSTAEWEELSLKATVTKAAVTAGKPVVDFTVVDQHNTPLKGLGYTGQNPASDPYPVFANMGFSIAKLIPATASSPSRWVSYIVTSNPTLAAPTTWVPTRPSTDSIGTLVDHGDGSYTYTFRRDISQLQAQLDAYTYTGANAKADLDNVAYDPSLTHRLTVYVGGAARGTGSNTPDRSNTGTPNIPVKFPANVAYDFIPSTGAPITGSNERRDIVDVTSCFKCHAKFEFHGEGRQDTRYCVVCHNDQRKYGYANATTPFNPVGTGQRKIDDKAVGDFPSFIHKLHMGEELTQTGYQYAGVLFNEVTYPQDHRNCTTCHTASTTTPQGDNWFNKPNRLACGGCHDNINFATGANSKPGGLAHAVQTSDAACAGCHTPAVIQTDHIPVVVPDPNNIWNTNGTNNNTNASYVAAILNNLPPGAHKVTWDLKTVAINASNKPEITFRFLKNGTPVVFNTYAAGTVTEMMDGFVGGPSIYIAYSVPQDGIATPADWNVTASTYLKNIWRGDGKDMLGNNLSATAVATLSGPDGTGYYKLTLTGVNVPTTASMITGGIGYTYGLTSTQPLTQIDLPAYPYTNPSTSTAATGAGAAKNQGGLAVPAPNVNKLVSGTLPAGFAAQSSRRAIVANSKCNDCHGALGVFTSKAYHAGQRNDATTCEFCHNGQRVNSGWGVNAKDFVHAIHGAGKRANKFSWESSAGDTYWKVTYPGVLNNCEACHLAGTYDFGRASNAAAVPNLLWTTVATGTTPNPMNVVITGNETIPGVYWSQFSKTAAAAANGGVPEGYAFGSGFSYNANTNVATPAAGTTLVNSPYVAACSNCHDSSLAIEHMKTNGGSFYASRASVQTAGVYTKQEQCFLCHSAGKIADTEKVHMNFK
ncbi:MAG TPA: OmcA/MtrC family decaheme c-type cytochrome [Holophagaceae bacterium]|nr:OmcA/MtrC family decaheme c-type cytochrome [Holophagaceae bacterium]